MERRKYMTEKLKPCPFCGKKAEFHTFYNGEIAAGCPKCGISTLHGRPTYEGERAYTKLAKTWNRRANDEG